MILLAALLSFAHAMTCFVDLNDAPKEIEACMNAIGDKNVFVITKSGAGKVTKDRVAGAMDALKNAGTPCTKMIFSGHQGSGHLMGSNGDLFAHDIHAMLKKHPTVNTMGFVACYAVNVHASQKFFLQPNKNIKQTVGFPIQSPTKENPDTAKMVGEYCKHGEEWADKSTKAELCDIYPGLAKLIPNQQLAICSREAVASHAYGKDLCYDYDELKKRCDDFDPGDAKIGMYEKFMAAADPCDKTFANPPVDKNSQYEAGGSPLRKFYSQVHLWRQCAEDFKANRRRLDQAAGQEATYAMPEPKQMIRLIKFDELKTNIARLNAGELQDYDQRLRDLCLDKFALGDISQLNRAQINAKIMGASRALNEALDGGARQPSSFEMLNTDDVVPNDDVGDDAVTIAEIATRGLASTYLPGLMEDVEDDAPAPRPAARPVAPRAPPKAVTPPVAAQPPVAPVVAAPRPVAPRSIAPADQVPVERARVAAPTAPAYQAPVERPRVVAPAQPAPAAPPASIAVAPAPPRPPSPARADSPAAPARRESPQCGADRSPPPRACQSPRTSPEVVEKMNAMLKWTLVDLNNAIGTDSQKTYRNCSHFHLIEPNAPQNYKSQCILSYQQTARQR